MHNELSDNFGKGKTQGWILYDGACPFCLRLLERFHPQIEAAGFLAEPLQSAWVRKRLKLPDAQLLAEMKLLLPTGEVYGGAGAIFRFASLIPKGERPVWAWLVVLYGKLPFAHSLAGTIYRSLAARRYCVSGECPVEAGPPREGKPCAQ